MLTELIELNDCVFEATIRHGRSLKGMRNMHAKLNGRRVQLARGLYEEGISISVIAHLFGVDYETIRKACNGDQWGHIQ